MSARGLNNLESEISQPMRHYWAVFLGEGIALLALGVLAILAPIVATLTITLAFGWIFLISGIIGLTTTLHARHAPGFRWSLVSAVLSLIVGLLLLVWPISGAISLTILLAAFFAADGIAMIMYALEHRRELSGRWGWVLLNGIVDLLLAAIILVAFQTSAGLVLGLLIGIDMILGGIALIGMALHAHASA